jgi:WD40 repeat protein
MLPPEVYCISCGAAFRPPDPETVLCPACGGPPEQADAPVRTQLRPEPAGTLRMPETEEPIGPVRMPAPDGPSGTHRADEPPSGRSFLSETDPGAPGAVPLLWEPGDTILDLYEVKKRIETGGMAVVYRVHHKAWNLDLAVKTPRREALEKDGGLDTFIKEAEAWIDLGLHPHIVSCHYVRKLGAEAVPRVFAEWASGGSLLEWIRSGRADTLPRRLDLAIQFAWGLAYAHEKGLVHRDVKPENALLTDDGTLKVTDFGLARARGRYCTPEYASPEQAMGQETDFRTDLWSWGLAVLYLLLGERTWADGTVALGALEKALDEGLETPDSLAMLLRACFQNDPGRRPTSMQAAADWLLQVYAQVAGAPYPRQQPKAAELRADSLNNRALSMLDLGREKDAVGFWEAAVKADSRHPESLFNYGLMQWRKGQIPDDELVRRLEDAISAYPENQQAKYCLGMVHIERSDVVAAAAAFEHSIQTSTSASGALSIAESVRSRAGASCAKTIQTAPLSSTSLLRNGQQIGIVGQMTRPVFWDLDREKPVIQFGGFDDSEYPLIAASANGTLLLEGAHRTLRLWDLAALRYLAPEKQKPAVFECESALRAIAISPDNRFLLSGWMDGTLAICDLQEDGEGEWDLVEAHHGDIRSVGFSSDGQWAITGGDDGRVCVLRLQDRQVIHEFTCPEVWAVVLSEDRRWLLAACRDSVLRLWDLQNPANTRLMIGHKDEVRSAAISTDGRFGLSGSHDQTARFWDLDSCRCLRTFSGHDSNVISVYFITGKDHELKGLSAAENGDVKIWNLSNIGSNPGYWALSLPAKSTEAASRERTARNNIEEARRSLENGDPECARMALLAAREIPGFEHDPELLKLTYELAPRIGKKGQFVGTGAFQTIKGDFDPTDQICVTNDGRFLITDSRELRVWDLHGNRFIGTVKGQAYTWYPPRPIVVTQDSKFLFAIQGLSTAQARSALEMVDLESCESACRLQHDHEIRDFQLHPNGSELITLTFAEDRTRREIHSWNIKDGRRTNELSCEHAVDRILVSSDGKQVVAGENLSGPGETQSLVVRALEKGRRDCDFQGLGAPFVCSPDPRIAVASGAGGLVVLDIESGRQVRILQESSPPSRSTSMRFTHDGCFFLAPHQQGLGVWAVKTGELVRQLAAPVWSELAHTILSEDGGWALAVGSVEYRQSSIYLWNLESTHLLHTIKIFADDFSMFLFMNDRFLACRSKEGVRIWQLDWEYEFPEPVDWDEDARPFLDIFLAHNPQVDRNLLNSTGVSFISDPLFQRLLRELALRGYGWLRPEGVRRKLEDLARERTGA